MLSCIPKTIKGGLGGKSKISRTVRAERVTEFVKFWVGNAKGGNVTSPIVGIGLVCVCVGPLRAG